MSQESWRRTRSLWAWTSRASFLEEVGMELAFPGMQKGKDKILKSMEQTLSQQRLPSYTWAAHLNQYANAFKVGTSTHILWMKKQRSRKIWDLLKFSW